MTLIEGQPPAVWRSDGSGDVVSVDGHGMDVMIATFSRSGDRLLTGSLDMTARSWRYLPDELVGFLATRTRACLTPRDRERLLDEPLAVADPRARACQAGR